MNRRALLGKLAALPVLGALLPFASPLEAVVTEDSPEQAFVMSGLVNGTYVQRVLPNMPNQAQVADAVRNGLDRIEVWIAGRPTFQGPLTAGTIPRGWGSLEHAGPIR